MIVGQIYRIFSVAVSLFCVVTVYGDEYTGIVQNGLDASMLEFVNVVGLRSDSTFVQGTVTDSVGGFVLSGDGITQLSFKRVGYEGLTIDVGDGVESPLTVRLQPMEVMLKEVDVTAKRPMTMLIGGDMVTAVENTTLANMPTVFETLSFVPMLSVQGESVSVFGKGTPIFYINSRRVRDNSELRDLLPVNIVSVKVITNPGVRYGPEVSCVVIIKTKKRPGDGLSGWFHDGMGVNSQFSNTIGLFMQYRVKGLEIFTQWFQNHTNSKTRMDYATDVFTLIPRREEFHTRYIDKANNLNGKIGFNYDFNRNHSIGGSYLLLWSKTDREGNSTTRQYENSRMSEWLQENNADILIWPYYLANLYYEGKVGDLAISSNFDYHGNSENTVSNYRETNPESVFSTDGSSSSCLLAENVILTYPVRNAEFTLGQEWTGTNYKSSFFSPQGVMNTSRSETDESTLALFASWKQRISRFFLEVGLRYEHRRVKYDGSDDNYRQTHDNLYPSLKFGGIHGAFSWNVGYRHDTYPPNYSMMSGEVYYVNRYTYQSGNPQLLTTRQQQVFLNAQYRSFWLQSGFSYQEYPVVHISDFYAPDPDIILQHWANLPDLKSMYVRAGYQTVVGHWRPSASVGIQKQWLEVAVDHKPIDLSQPIYTIATDHSIELPWGFTVYGQYSFRSSGDTQLDHMRYSHNLTIGIAKSFLKNSLTVQVWGRDLLDQQKATYVTYGNAAINNGVTDRYFRRLQLSIRYCFNPARSRYKGRGAGSSEKNRLR